MRETQRLLRRSQLDRSTSIEDAISRIEALVGRKVQLHAEDLGPGIAGMTVTDSERGVTHVFYSTRDILTPTHRRHVIAHELGHVVAASSCAEVAAVMFRRTRPGKGNFSERAEYEAEMFAVALGLAIDQNLTPVTDRLLGLGTPL